MSVYMVVFRKEVRVLVDAEDEEDAKDAVDGMLRDKDGMEDFAEDHQAEWKAAVRAAKQDEVQNGGKPLKIDRDADT